MEQPLSQVVPVDRPDGRGRHGGLEGSYVSNEILSLGVTHGSLHPQLLALANHKGSRKHSPAAYVEGRTGSIWQTTHQWLHKLNPALTFLSYFTPLHSICYYLTYFCVLTVCGHVDYIA